MISDAPNEDEYTVTLDEAYEASSQGTKLAYYNDGAAFTAYGVTLLRNDCEASYSHPPINTQWLQMMHSTFWTVFNNNLGKGFEVDRGSHEPVYQVLLKNARGNIVFDMVQIGNVNSYIHTRFLVCIFHFVCFGTKYQLNQS